MIVLVGASSVASRKPGNCSDPFLLCLLSSFLMSQSLNLSITVGACLKADLPIIIVFLVTRPDDCFYAIFVLKQQKSCLKSFKTNCNAFVHVLLICRTNLAFKMFQKPSLSQSIDFLMLNIKVNIGTTLLMMSES